MSELIGQTLGHYRVEALLARGATGEIYRAGHLYRARSAAIKVLDGSMTLGPDFAGCFAAEMRDVAGLQHAHIAALEEFGEQGGRFYLTTELVTVGSLRAYLRRAGAGRALPLDQALDLARQAAEGLGHAHARGIVHKDVKPSNLLLDDATGRGADGAPGYVLKVTDFGLVRLAQCAGALGLLGGRLGTGAMLGAPAYMSPEQCRGLKLDGRSDLYALGVVLYEMVAGRTPFAATTLREAYAEHVSAEPPPPRRFAPGLPEVVEAIILRCLAKRPEERYASGEELAAALGAAPRTG